MRINPLTYGTEALRALLFPASAVFSASECLIVLAGFSIAMFAIAFAIASRRTTKPAA
jgi:ABC-2 type transport system permease protein